MSLRWKVAAVLAVLVSVATIALGAAGYRSTRARLLAEVDRSLIAVDARIDERWFGPQGVTDERGPFGFAAQVVAADGTVLHTTFPEPIPVTAEQLGLTGVPRATTFDTVDTSDGRYRVRSVGFRRGIVQVGRSLDETERVLQSLRLRTLAWTLSVAGLAIVAGLWSAGRVTASLRRLTAAAEHVESTGRLDVRVGEDGSDEVGRLGAAFDGMLAALARSKDDQQRLVQDAGHELRTPLTSLRTNLDMLERYPAMGDADRAAIVADLHAETRELTDLVNEIVTLASGAHSDEPPSEFDLADVAAELADRFRRRTGRTIVLVAEPTPVVAQRAAIQRAVSCLLDNAVKFDEGDGPIDVTVGRGGVAVRDHGPGIPDVDLDRVFERFHRSDAARAQPGSGLGLAIVREIVGRHGGSVSAANAPDGGAVVGFRLPV